MSCRVGVGGGLLAGSIAIHSVGRPQRRHVFARHPPHNPCLGARILGGPAGDGYARGRCNRRRGAEGRRGGGHGRGLHSSRHGIGGQVACWCGPFLAGVGGVGGRLPSKRQTDGGCTNDSGSGTELYHMDPSVMAPSTTSYKRDKATWDTECAAALPCRRIRSVETYQNKTRAMERISSYTDYGLKRRRAVFTDGTVFILVENQAAGESSLVEAPVTTSRALWHVKVPRNHGSRAARVWTGGKWRGSIRHGGKRNALQGEAKEGRHKSHDGLKQRGGARRGADGRLKKSSACCFWDLRTGLPSAHWD